jgi:PRTRC genetic system ThiF family protein
VITCVDSLKARAKLYRQMLTAKSEPPVYWLDCGNAAETGQVILGEPEWLGAPRQFERRPRLRHVVDLFPGMLEAAESEVPEGPSCTQAVALGLQGLPINRLMADTAQMLLWRLFRDGGLTWNGAFVNARTGRMNPIPVLPDSAPALPGFALPGEASRTVRPRRRLRAAARERVRAA